MRHCMSRGAAALLVAALFSCLAAAAETDLVNSRETWITRATERAERSIVCILRPNSTKIMGTGVIFEERGWIVTNYHVVVDAATVKVRLIDGTELTATVRGREDACDLAVLKVSTTKKLHALKLAPADDLRQGESVLAIGHPHGLDYSIATGIISSLRRDIELETKTLYGMIQTTAGINRGNSGGALLNVNGEWIGINTAVMADAQGIAFAINSGTVRTFLSKHVSAMKLAGVTHGLKVEDKTLAKTGDRQRVVVTGTSEQTKDLAPGDVILAIGDFGVSNTLDIERAFWDKRAGDKVQLKVNRQGKELIVPLNLSAGIESTPIGAVNPAKGGIPGASSSGLRQGSGAE